MPGNPFTQKIVKCLKARFLLYYKEEALPVKHVAFTDNLNTGQIFFRKFSLGGDWLSDLAVCKEVKYSHITPCLSILTTLGQ